MNLHGLFRTSKLCRLHANASVYTGTSSTWAYRHEREFLFNSNICVARPKEDPCSLARGFLIAAFNFRISADCFVHVAVIVTQVRNSR